MQAAGAACGGEGRGGSKVGRGGGKIRLPAHERKAFRASTEVGLMFAKDLVKYTEYAGQGPPSNTLLR